MIIDDSRNVLAHLKAELHEESAVKASADMNIGDIVYLEMDENDGLTLRNGYATRKKYVVIIGKNEKGIIAKTICTNFQNEMCIFFHFFAVRLPAWNII